MLTLEIKEIIEGQPNQAKNWIFGLFGVDNHINMEVPNAILMKPSLPLFRRGDNDNENLMAMFKRKSRKYQ